jgi:arylsulfatase A-like enzyme
VRTILSLLMCGMSLAAAERPNVLMIIGDDWGYPDYGFMAHPDVKTPNLDRLAAEGCLFPNGYTPTSLCRASLATILTGQYGHQHKICCNDPPEGVARDAMLPFLKNSPALPRLLGDTGYKSFQTGKFWEGAYQNGGFTHGMTTKGRHGDDGLTIGRQSLAPILNFLDRADKNWLIWYAPMMPHEPHTPPARLLKKYAVAGRDLRLAKYYAMCEWTDETIGTLWQSLEYRGLTRNLLTVFVVDNGWVQSQGPAKKGDQFGTRSKNTPYEAGVRTPVILHWPGEILPGRRDDLVSTVDLAPTILNAAGAAVPKGVSGVSLLPVARGRVPLARDAVFGEIYVHTALKLDDPVANLTHRWVRQGNWKLIESAKGAVPELYDLAADPGEKTNLATTKPDVRLRLQKRLADDWPGWAGAAKPPG